MEEAGKPWTAVDKETYVGNSLTLRGIIMEGREGCEFVRLREGFILEGIMKGGSVSVKV